MNLEISGLNDRTACAYLRRHPLDRCSDPRTAIEIVRTIIHTGSSAMQIEVSTNPIGELTTGETILGLAGMAISATELHDFTVTAGRDRKPYFAQ
jgi:hypothetical protein